MAAWRETRNFFPVRERTPGLRRIFTIGDSMTYGAEVFPEETLASYLELALNAAYPSLFFEVKNLGQNGANFWNAWATFVKHYLPLGADGVVFSICHNDTCLFDTTTVRYAEEPWMGSPQLQMVFSQLRDIAQFARRTGIFVILHYYTYWHGDIERIRAVEVVCDELGLPFVDMYSFYKDEIGLPVDEYAASPFDGHPSGRAHELAAGRIVSELQHHKLLPTGEAPIEVAGEIERLVRSMLATGRAADEALYWGNRVLAAKVRSLQRRRNSDSELAIGDAEGVLQRLAHAYLAWRRSLATVAAGLESIAQAEFWDWMTRAFPNSFQLDELLHCLSFYQEPEEIQLMDHLLFQQSNYFESRVGDLVGVIPDQLIEIRDRVAATLRKLLAETTYPTARLQMPATVASFVDLAERLVRNVEHFLKLEDVRDGRVDLNNPRYRLLQVAMYLASGCDQYFRACLPYVEQALAPLSAANDMPFFTSIDVTVEAPGGGDDANPRSNLYVEVTYKVPDRWQLVDRQVVAVDVKRWIYKFRFPLFALATVKVYFNQSDGFRERFENGETIISAIDIYNGDNPPSDGSHPRWQYSNGGPSEIVELARVMP